MNLIDFDMSNTNTGLVRKSPIIQFVVECSPLISVWSKRDHQHESLTSTISSQNDHLDVGMNR